MCVFVFVFVYVCVCVVICFIFYTLNFNFYKLQYGMYGITVSLISAFSIVLYCIFFVLILILILFTCAFSFLLIDMNTTVIISST